MNLLWLLLVLDLLSPTRHHEAVIVVQLQPIPQVLIVQLLFDEFEIKMSLRIISLHRDLLEITLGQPVFQQILTCFGGGVGAEEISNEAIRQTADIHLLVSVIIEEVPLLCH